MFISLLFCVICTPGFSQQNIPTKTANTFEYALSDSIITPPEPVGNGLGDKRTVCICLDGISDKTRKNRIKTIAIINVAGYGAAMAGLYAAWYKDYPQGKFHAFNDISEWKGMDKIGHTYSAYAESKASMELWRWTGIDRKKRILLGGFSGAIYQTTIEILDGFSTEWGWSWGDFGANILGSGMLVAQEFAWDEQRIQFKWSFHRKSYDDPGLNARSNDIFGKSSPERFLKDYNGQTYWLSTSLKPFFPHSRIPAWLQVSVGTGIEGVFGARSNVAKDDQGVVTFDRSDIKRRRQWYLAPDIDLTKIKTKKRGVKLALTLLNIIKFPTPSLEYSKGKMSVNWFHF
ncbi:DUF2279 domain-containing protein [Ferruginibacter sp. HRS2-29]|uniref:DUF2279 domain-containing protein n=1 Tax=Ferruginibacter sp. HRS2-29 TaxID=2487334 RepID=UPI0020CEF2FD|nr:DUF2279 domain-containing protein [Ferruginibacter sp. HRS2-29]